MKKLVVALLSASLCVALAYEHSQSKSYAQKYEEIVQDNEKLSNEFQTQNLKFIKSINQELDSIVYALKQNNSVLLYDSALKLQAIIDVCTIDGIEKTYHLNYYGQIAVLLAEISTDPFPPYFDAELRQRFAERIESCTPIERGSSEASLLELLNHLHQVASSH